MKWTLVNRASKPECSARAPDTARHRRTCQKPASCGENSRDIESGWPDQCPVDPVVASDAADSVRNRNRPVVLPGSIPLSLRGPVGGPRQVHRSATVE